MSVSSHAICDHCEKKLVPLEDESPSESYLLDSGWVCVKWSEDDEDEWVERAMDFCSFPCAAQWCLVADEVLVARDTFLSGDA